MKISVGLEMKLWKQKVIRGPRAPERSSWHSLPLGVGRGLPGGPSGGPAALWAAVCLISAGTESR